MLPQNDPHGRRSITGVLGVVSERHQERTAKDRRNMYPPQRNGIHDATTFWHLLDVLLQAVPDEQFRTIELVSELRERRPRIAWDAVTVGRVMTDIAESLFEANARRAITYVRRWDGMHFSVSRQPEARTAMENLLSDLRTLVQEQMTGRKQSRMISPLLRCPSVMRVAA